MNPLRQQIIERYQQLVQDRIDAFRDMISALSDDARNDAKGSAGDKHETALSMMQLEQEKLTYKLREFLDQKSVLDKIANAQSTSKTAVLGSVVLANDKYFFISAALPKITIDDKTIFAVSPQSPLGHELIGKRPGDSLAVGATNYVITEVR